MAEHKSHSYKDHRGDDCFYFCSNTENTPCWGKVEVIHEECTEDFEHCWDVPACRGHWYMWFSCDDGKYRPEPKEIECLNFMR